MEMIPAHISNYQAGRNAPITYLVVHYTGNPNDTARNNCKYFQSANRKASAHFFVDEREIVQSVAVDDTAWAVGDGNGKYGITNSNSLSIEMCNFLAWNDAVVNRTIPLIRELRAKYNIPIERVVRHYDASRKLCPKPLVSDNEWQKFKSKITESEESEMIYNYIDDNMPSWAKPTIQKLHDRGLLKGNEHGELGLNDTMLRILVILDRTGVFDK